MEVVVSSDDYHLKCMLRPFGPDHPVWKVHSVPRDKRFRAVSKGSRTKGMGVAAPGPGDGFNVVAWACYQLLYGRPGIPNAVVGIEMNRAFHVDLRTVSGYLLAKNTGPRSPAAHIVWMRQVAGVVARPNLYREAVDVWECLNPDGRFSDANPVSITIQRSDQMSQFKAFLMCSFETVFRCRGWTMHARGASCTLINNRPQEG
jgi:hypothetical protein